MQASAAFREAFDDGDIVKAQELRREEKELENELQRLKRQVVVKKEVTVKKEEPEVTSHHRPAEDVPGPSSSSRPQKKAKKAVAFAK